jgi:hypothetical protein
VASLQETLGPQLGQLRFGVSRVDLFSDWQGWSLTLGDAHHFVCRADARRTYEVGGILTGFEFGTRKTEAFSARLYDKTADIAAKGNEWWHEVWGDRYVAGTPVRRLEFEIGRQGLERVREPASAGGGPARTSQHAVDQLEGQRRKLLRLYYDDRIGADLFAEEEARLALAIAAAHGEAEGVRCEVAEARGVSRRFEEVARVLENLDIDRAWAAATESERRILIEELVENVTVHPDHLEVTVSGAPRLHVLYQEVGLKESGPDRVRGGTSTLSPRESPLTLAGQTSIRPKISDSRRTDCCYL